MANRVPKGYFRGQATRPSNVRVPLAVTAVGDELYAVTVPRNSRDVASNFSYANAASGTSKKLVNSKTKATIVLWSYQKLDDLECGLAPEQWPKRNCGFPWTRLKAFRWSVENTVGWPVAHYDVLRYTRFNYVPPALSPGASWHGCEGL